MSEEKVGTHIPMVNISRTVHFLKFSELLLTMIFRLLLLRRPTCNFQSWKTGIVKRMSLESMMTAESRVPQSPVLFKGQITCSITRCTDQVLVIYSIVSVRISSYHW